MAESNYLLEETETGVDFEPGDDQFVVSLGPAKSTELVPLAFTIAADLQPIPFDGLAVSWTKEGIASFSKIRQEAQASNTSLDRTLPYGSLHALMEMALPHVARIERAIGLDDYCLNLGPNGASPFLFLDTTEVDQVRGALSPIVHDWAANFLGPQYLDPIRITDRLRQRVTDLAQCDGLLSIEKVHTRLLPWNSGSNGTAQPPDRRRGFQLLIDQVARFLAGKELFKGLGAMRRIVASRPGAQGVVELISDPIESEDRGAFSLVVSLEVVTFPSLPQPLVTLNVQKRLWLRGLSERTVDHRAIGGTVFSSLHPNRVLSFQLRRRKCEDAEWRWMPDNAFEALKRDLALPLGRIDAHSIARGDASTATARVLLIHRDSISQGRHGIKRGVPEIDKLEAFDIAAQILKPIGVIPFRGYTRLRTKHARENDAISRMINTPTLLGAALEVLSNESTDDLTPGYLKTLDDHGFDDLLRREFQIGLAKIKDGTRIIRYENRWGHAEKDQSIDLETLIAANREAISRLYPGDRPLLLFFYEDGAGPDLQILKSVVRLLWGDALDIMTNRLPADAHGPRTGLPGSELKGADRSSMRIERWRSVAEQIARLGRRVFCLVMARDRYPDPRDPDVRRVDDPVNKPAARQALATIGRACVQYLLPPTTSAERGTIDLADFLIRAQAAMKDLISAHSGRIEGVRDAVAHCFSDSDTMRRSMPREIIAITIVRKNSGRYRGGINMSFLPVAVRIDVQTERCDMCCAYEGQKGFTISPWERFSDSLATVSRVSPVRLASKREVAKSRFADFVDQIISESVEDGANPVVIIDSSNCVQLWSWLADQKLDVSNIELGQKQWMQDNWKGARIIRIRQDLAPGIVERKEQRWAFTSPGDTRDLERLPADLSIAVPSSPVGLFRLTSAQQPAGSISYLSVGHKTLHMNKRGPSCYRATKAVFPYHTNDPARRREALSNAAGLPIALFKRREPWHGQWPTPNPLEIVVTLRQASDDPDRLAELVEHLRYGFGHYSEWTTLPAPLFFERVIRDYISGFALEKIAAQVEVVDEATN